MDGSESSESLHSGPEINGIDRQCTPKRTEKLQRPNDIAMNAEPQKRESIHNQMRVWTKLLEIRIHFEKVLKLSASYAAVACSQSNEVTERHEKNMLNLKQVLNQMIEIENVIVLRSSASSGILANRSTKKTPSVAHQLTEMFESNKPHREAVVKHWQNRVESKNRTGAIPETSKLTEPQKDGRDLLDDSEFYSNLLQEFIKNKIEESSTPNNKINQTQFLQKIRDKMSNKIATRIAKGRKIRYIIHEKMVNFMTKNDSSLWTRESSSELFSSLFRE